MGRLGFVLRIVISAGLLTFLLFKVDIRLIIDAIKEAKVHWLVALLGLQFAQRFFGAFRWHVLVRSTNKTVGFGAALRICFVANFVGLFLPGVVGMEALRIYGLARKSADVATSVSSVLVDRLLGLISLMILAVVGLSIAPDEFDPTVAKLSWGLLTLLVVVIAVMLLPATRRMIERLMPRAITDRIEGKLSGFYACLRIYRSRPLLMICSLLMAIVFQLTRVGVFLLGALALGLGVPAIYFFAFVPVIVFAAMMPLSIGGLGVSEAGFVYFFKAHEMNTAAGFALALFVYVSTVVSALPGAILYACGRGAGQTKERGAKSDKG